MPVYKSTEMTKDGRKWYFKFYYTDILTGKSKAYKSKKYSLKSEAANAEAKKKLQLTNITSQNKITLNHVYEKFLNSKKISTRPQNIRKIEATYRHIDSYFNNVEIDKITVPMYEQFRDRINAKDFSVTYKNKILQLTKAIIRYSRKMYGTSCTVPELFENIKDNTTLKEDPKFYTFDEFNSFINQITDTKWNAFFKMLYFCGTRKNEANALTWNDIDFENKTIRINKTVITKLLGVPYTINPPKTPSSNRVIPMTNVVLKAMHDLKTYYSQFDKFKDEWYCFGGVRPLSESSMDNVKATATKKAKLPKIRMHDFRHSCASLLINNGANVTVVAKYLGHANIEQTLNTYSHMFIDRLDEVVEKLNEITKNST